MDALSAELWELGTVGIRELESNADTLLIAGFENNSERAELLRRFEAHRPEWEQEDATDWVQHTQEAWPPREVGDRIFLAAPWVQAATPEGRVRVVHNPGLASGTGEHPCTQLALAALEQHVRTGDTVADIGAGSGMLAIAALHLGARVAIGIDPDQSALGTAKENFELNGHVPLLAAGSAECVRSASMDVVVANISGTVLFAILQDLLRIVKPEGKLILSGFPEWELAAFERLFSDPETTGLNEWRCVVGRPQGLRAAFTDKNR